MANKLKFTCCYCGSSNPPTVEVFKEKNLSLESTPQDIMDTELGDKQYKLICSNCFRINYVCDTIFKLLSYLGLK